MWEWIKICKQWTGKSVEILNLGFSTDCYRYRKLSVRTSHSVVATLFPLKDKELEEYLNQP